MWLPSLREYARLHRGLLVAAPVFWAAFTVFLNPWFGAVGFAIHSLLCLPRGKPARTGLLIAYPLLALWFSLRDPFLTLEDIPFHRESTVRNAFHFREGEVADFPASSHDDGSSFLLNTVEGVYRVSLPNGNPPDFGATVLMTGKEEPPEQSSNPGQRDPRNILRAQGAIASLRTEAWTQLKTPPIWKKWLASLRVHLGKSLEKNIPAPALPLVAAALLNDTRGVSAETQQDFLRSGMQHILAISGQHIGLLVAFLLLPALCLRLPRKFAFIGAAALTAIYIPVTGAPVSVARAGLMLACLLPSILFERPHSGLNAFCLAAAVDLVMSPFHILNLGFQLSYAATLALILCASPSRCAAGCFKNRLIGSGVQMLLLSAMVTAFTYPILAASTHAMAPWSVIGNLVTIPVSSAMLIGGLCTWAFSPFPPLAHCCGAFTGFFSMLLEGCVHFLARLPGALWSIAAPGPLWLILLSASALTLALLLRAHRWRLGMLCAAILITAEIFRPCLSGSFPGGARVTLLSVGHGDAAVLELAGAVIVIDDGPSPRTARQVIIPFLQSRGICRLDAVLLTHPDMDHYGGTFGLIDRIPIGFIIAPPMRSSDAPWNCLKAEVRSRGIPWKEGRLGDLLYQKGNVTLRILGPGPAFDSDASDNNHSLVCLLQTAKGKALFTGDIEGAAQRALAETWPLWRGAWLKAPHHGSDRTTLPCFLAAVAPPQAAISSGRRPGFPGPATVALLESLHANVGITARDGAILWKFPSGGNAAQSQRFRMKL